MDYKTASETAARWSLARIITPHAVQVLCAAGRVPGADHWAGRWMVPPDAVDPRGARGWKKGKLRGKKKKKELSQPS